MAKIPRSERQVSESAVSLPRATGGARIAEALGGIANIAGAIGTKLRVEDAAIQGAEERLKGGPKKLAPGITPATEAYNKAFLNVDNQLNLMSLEEQMKFAYLEASKPGNLSQDSPNLFSSVAQAQIKGVMNNVVDQNKPEFALQAMKMASNYGLQLQYLANQKSAEELKATSEVMLSKELDKFTNATRSEQPALAQEAKEQYLSTLKDVKQLTGMDAVTEQKYKDAIRDAEISSMFYKRGQNDVIASPGSAEKQLYDFAVNPPEGYTPLEQDTALKAYIAGVSSVEKLKNEQNTINGLQIGNDIDTGKINSAPELEQKRNDVDAATYLRAQNHLFAKQSKALSGQVKVNDFLQRAQLGGGFQNLKTTNETKEVAFVQLKQAYINSKRDKLGDSTLELTPQDEADILKQLNANIPSIDVRVNYALQNADLEGEVGNVAWALAMVRGVAADKPNAINLTDKSRAIALAANAMLQWGGESNVAKAVDAARKKVNAKEADIAGRATQFRNKTKKEITQSFNKVFPTADPNRDKTTYGAFLQNYELYYLLTDSDDEALEGTRQAMQNTYGQSKYFREGQVGYLPLEKIIPGAELGGRVWLDNQIKLLALNIAEHHKTASVDELDPRNKVEWVGSELPKDVKTMNVAEGLKRPIQEDDLFNYGKILLGDNRSPTGIMYRIRGQDRPVYVEADSMTRVGDGDGLRVRFYTIDPSTQLSEYVVDPKSQSGFAYVNVEPLQQFLPNTYEGLTTQDIDEWASNVATEEYKEKHKIPLLRAFGFADYVKQRKPEVIKKLKELKGSGDKKPKELLNIDIYRALEDYSAEQESAEL